MAVPRGTFTRNIDAHEKDLYNTPNKALVGLAEQYPDLIQKFHVFYDPCDGLGVISDFLEHLGKKVYRADIVNYKKKLNFKKNFLKTYDIPEDVECIIFNPPFSLTEQFIDKALSLNKHIIMFNRVTTLEGQSRTRKFKSGVWPLKTVYPFGFRVTCTRGLMMVNMGQMVAYAWFYFELGYTGKPFINFITK